MKMIYYAIRNDEGKYLRRDSRWLEWNDLPNCDFWLSSQHAKDVIKHFFEQEYNPITHYDKLFICEIEMDWEHITELDVDLVQSELDNFKG
jgi:hypothetical protein